MFTDHFLRSVSIFAVRIALLWAFSMGLADKASALNDYPRNDLWVTDGQIFAVARSADAIYIGGDFDTVAPYIGSAALVSPATGALAPIFPVVKGVVVRCAVPDGAGGWYLGGFFTAVDDYDIQHLVHILPSGEVNPDFSFSFGGVGGNFQGGVLAMDLTEAGLLYVVGSFNAVNGEPRNNSAAIDTTTGTLTDWAPALTTFGPSAVHATDDVVYLEQSQSLAAVDAETGALQVLNAGNVGAIGALVRVGNIL